MALTLTHLPEFQFSIGGQLTFVVFDVTFDSSYPAGGEAVDADKDLGFGAIAGMQVIGSNAVAAALMLAWDTVNGKLMVHYPTGGAAASPAALADPAQAVPTVDSHASGQTVTARLAGANTITTWLDATALSDTPALAHVVSAPGNGIPGRGKEVLAATDLTTCTWRIAFFCN